MPTITCQYTGIKFEAKTARTKNHPLVSRLLSELSKERDFSYALALESFKSNTFETAEEYIAQARQEIKARYEKISNAKKADRESEKVQEQKRAEAKARRDAQNAHLKAHGYKWDTETRYGNEYDERGSEVWVLYDPQGAPISVEQAIAEIERGAEVVRAAFEAAKQAELAAKQAEEQAIAQALATYEVAKADAGIEKMTQVSEPIPSYSHFSRIYNAAGREVWVGEINGVKCAVIGNYSYDSDIVSMYCADPESAGLKTVKTQSDTPTLADTFAMFFS